MVLKRGCLVDLSNYKKVAASHSRTSPSQATELHLRHQFLETGERIQPISATFLIQTFGWPMLLLVLRKQPFDPEQWALLSLPSSLSLPVGEFFNINPLINHLCFSWTDRENEERAPHHRWGGPPAPPDERVPSAGGRRQSALSDELPGCQISQFCRHILRRPFNKGDKTAWAR